MDIKKNKNLLGLCGLILAFTVMVYAVQLREDIRQHAESNNQSSTSNAPKSQFTANQSSSILHNATKPTITSTQSANASNQDSSDTIPPALSITSPASGTIIRGGTNLTLSASASDNTGVTNVETLINGGIICTANSAPYTCLWAVPATPNITYTVVIRAYDATGNVSSKSIIVTTSL